MTVLRTIREALCALHPRQRRLFWLLVAGMVVGSMLEIAGLSAVPMFLRLLLQETPAQIHPWLGNVFEQVGATTASERIKFGGLIVAALFGLQTSALLALAYARSRFISVTIRDISTRLFEGYLTASLTYHTQRQSATISSMIVIEAMRFINGFFGSFMRLLQSFFLVAAIGLLLTWANPAESLVVLAGTAALAGLILMAMRKRARQHGRTFTRQNALLAQDVNEALGCFRHIRLRGLEPRVVAGFEANARARADAIGFKRFANEAPKPLLEGLAVLGLLLIVLLTATSGATLQSMLPQLGLLGAAIGRLLPHINRGTTSALAMQQTANVAKTLTADLAELDTATATESQNVPSALGQPARLLQDRIRLRNLSFTYPGAASPSIRNVSLDIPKDAAVAFVGPTGAGKSTLVDVIAGLVPPTDGRIMVDEKDIGHVRTTWQRHIGYIPQTIFIADRNLRENVALGERPENIDDARVEHVLREAQLAEVLDDGWPRAGRDASAN